MESPTQTLSLRDRYILTRVGDRELAFAASWVADIIVLRRSQILDLPFYDPAVEGVVHHQGQIVPLLSALAVVSGTQTDFSSVKKDRVTAVRLSQLADDYAGVALVVDQVLGSLSQEKVLAQKQKSSTEMDGLFSVFQRDNISSSVWQPLRWSAPLSVN